MRPRNLQGVGGCRLETRTGDKLLSVRGERKEFVMNPRQGETQMVDRAKEQEYHEEAERLAMLPEADQRRLERLRCHP